MFANSTRNFLIVEVGQLLALSAGDFSFRGTHMKFSSDKSWVRSGSFDTSRPRVILTENSSEEKFHSFSTCTTECDGRSTSPFSVIVIWSYFRLPKFNRSRKLAFWQREPKAAKCSSDPRTMLIIFFASSKWCPFVFKVTLRSVIATDANPDSVLSDSNRVLISLSGIRLKTCWIIVVACFECACWSTNSAIRSRHGKTSIGHLPSALR